MEVGLSGKGWGLREVALVVWMKSLRLACRRIGGGGLLWGWGRVFAESCLGGDIAQVQSSPVG